MNFAKWAGAAALLAAPERIWRLLSAGAVQRVQLYGYKNELPGILFQYLRETATTLWSPTGPFRQAREFDRRVQAHATFACEDLLEVPHLFLYRRVPLLFSALLSRKTLGNPETPLVELTFPRGMVDVDALLTAACAYNQSDHGAGRPGLAALRFEIHLCRGSLGRDAEKSANRRLTTPGDPVHQRLPSGWRFVGVTEGDIGPPTPGRAADWIWWSESASLLRADAKRWRNRQVWCAERGIPWRRAWMLHGAPGNGKTQALIAIAQELDLPLYSFGLAEMCSRDFEDAYHTACSNAPAMVVIEDLHTIFKGQESLVEGGLSFNTLLDCLSGVSRNSGVLVGFTTNDLAAVDAALCQSTGPAPHDVSRPDRVDLLVEFTNPTAEGRRSVAMRILRDAELAEKAAAACGGHSIAQVQDYCYRVARDM